MALIGYARAPGVAGGQFHALQRDALIAAGVSPADVHSDLASVDEPEWPGLQACLETLQAGDLLLVWKLDRLGRDLGHVVALTHGLLARGVALKPLASQGSVIDGRPEGLGALEIFAALAELEGALAKEKILTRAERQTVRSRRGGRPAKMTPDKIRLALSLMNDPRTNVSHLCAQLGVARPTLYRFVDASGGLRDEGRRMLAHYAKTPGQSSGDA